MNQKNTIIVSSVFVVVIIIGAVVYWMQLHTTIAPAKTASSIVTQPVVPVQKSNDETASWNTFSSDKYGITYKYPNSIQFEGKEIANPDEIVYAITANYENDGINFFDFTVNDKVASKNLFDELMLDVQRTHVSKEIKTSNNTIILSDGIGTADDYFMHGYLVGKRFNYEFTLSRKAYSKDILDLYMKMLGTITITE